MDLAKTTRRSLLICVLLGAVTLITFWPQTSHDFITYDDSLYLTDNAQVQQGLTWHGVAWAFRTGETGNWHPLTWLSHMLDVQLFGLDAGWHHLTSLLFHTANAVLLCLLLQLMTGAVWRSAFVAALFALHPLHVQSVAWAAERKDVLSAFFFMLTLLAYARYAMTNDEGRMTKEGRMTNDEGRALQTVAGRGEEGAGNIQHPTSNIQHPIIGARHAGSNRRLPSSFYYVLALVAFALGLMCKPMLVTVPFVLLLLDYWPLRRFRVSSLESRVLSPQSPVHSPQSTVLSSFGNRPSFVIRPSSFVILEKLPFLALSAASCAVTLWAQTGGGAVVPVAVLTFSQRVANTVAAYGGYLEKMLWPAKLALFYPLAGDVPLGSLLVSAAVLAVITGCAVWSWRTRPHLCVGWFWYLGMLVPVIGLVQVGMQRMADRYTYLPAIGVFIMVTWQVSEWLGGFRWGRWTLGVAAGLILAACVVTTSRELSYWQDSEHIFARALEVAPANYVALDNYGRALLKQHKLPEAAQAFSAAVALRPDLDASRCGLGTALQEQGKYDEAAEQFVQVLKLQPDNFVALAQLGLVRGRQGKLEEAAERLSHALRLRPDDAGAHNNLGGVLVLQGNYAEAARQFEETVRLRPNHIGALNNLALACKKLGRTEEAVAHYREALRLQPDSVESLNNLAWTLAACPDARFRDGAEAVIQATRACELTGYTNPMALTTLGAAYGEVGQFAEAISFAEQAQQLVKGGQSALATRLAAMLEAFHAGRAYRAE
jgi:protein O-mannosyl-transferase